MLERGFGYTLGNCMRPLQIGAQDMAFPRLNAFAFWLAVPGALLVLMSMPLGGFETGWTGYPPLSVRGPMGIQMFFLGVFTAGWSSILGSLNVIATVLRMRAKGMTAMRMPIFVWASIATSIIALTATQLIGLSFQLVMFQRLLGMGFFDPTKGGNPVLFQHLFWFYSHPAVYVFVLPGLGIISELLPVFVRKPLFGYRWVAMSSLGIALVGFQIKVVGVTGSIVGFVHRHIRGRRTAFFPHTYAGQRGSKAYIIDGALFYRLCGGKHGTHFRHL